MTPEEAKQMPILSNGDATPEVPVIKALLRSTGNWKGSDSDQFGPQLEEAVRYFQSTHLGPDGKYLQGDGVVGPSTWWSLYNNTGDKQKSNIEPPPHEDRPTGSASFEQRYGALSTRRRAFISALFAEHAKGVREIPDGSNQGGEVNKYIKGFGPAPWCALFQNWCFMLVMGRYPLDAEGKPYRQAHVQSGIESAKKQGRFYAKGTRPPTPGDLAVWAFPGGSGHVSAVVATDQDGDQINTIGGNEGNRVKLGLRDLNSEPRLVGFIDLFGDSKELSQKFKRGLLKGGEAGSLTAGGSR